MPPKIALVLSGCGVYDGAEITEAIIASLAIQRQGYSVEFLAPDILQFHVVNHLTGEVAKGERRNVLVEAARIARGKVTDLGKADISQYHAAVFAGGFGAAKNLCTYASDGTGARVDPATENFIRALKVAGKPMAFLCISPVLAARVLGGGVEVTVGNSASDAAAIEEMGGHHMEHKVDECHVDRKNRVVSAPAYMYDASPLEIEKGINVAVAELVKLTK